MEKIDYTGWKMYDKVNLVIRQKPTIDRYRQAYVVDPSNNASLKSARNWATKYSSEKPQEILLDNNNFKVEFYESAGQSNNGGKLSFWNCIIRKDGLEFLIGINSDLLVSLLRKSKCNNGKIEEAVSFARKNGNLGLIHPGMIEYEHAVKDKLLTKKFAKRTSKHDLGRQYHTVSKTNIYLGDIYQWFEHTEEEVKRGWNKVLIDKYKLLNEPIVRHIFVEEYCIMEELKLVNTISDLYKRIEYNLDDYIQKVNDGVREFSYNNLTGNVIVLGDRHIVEKLPARTPGDIVLTKGDNPNLTRIIEKLRMYALKYNDNRYSVNTSNLLSLFGYSQDIDDKPIFSQEEKDKIIGLFGEYVIIDFGDGVELKGTR